MEKVHYIFRSNDLKFCNFFQWFFIISKHRLDYLLLYYMILAHISYYYTQLFILVFRIFLIDTNSIIISLSIFNKIMTLTKSKTLIIIIFRSLFLGYGFFYSAFLFNKVNISKNYLFNNFASYSKLSIYILFIIITYFICST